MFNLIISYDPETWDLTPYKCDRSRAIVEYTADEISERYKFFDQNAIEELKSFPTLFVTENESVESRIGYITEVRVGNNSVMLNYEFDPILPSLPIGAIEAIRDDIDLGRYELSRTHWAVKDEPIFEILMRHGYLNQAQVNAAIQRRMPPPPVLVPDSHDDKEFNTSQVFIVHGHDDLAKLDVANFITSLGLQPIILHMQASSGMTIIEKIEHYSNVGFGIVLYTPCDTGAKVGALSGRYRARQNVVFEHGYLIGKLGRPRVCAVVKGDIETPNDISGVVYVSMDASLGWQEQLKLEMRNVGYKV
ncbi:TPA: nucleotide-binding protein [Aeromonas hydrophila]|nr:nucleotide-binding protein [Aeromonas hydrophila]